MVSVFTTGRSFNIRRPVGLDIISLCKDWSAKVPVTSASAATMSCRSGSKNAVVAECTAIAMFWNGDNELSLSCRGLP